MKSYLLAHWYLWHSSILICNYELNKPQSIVSNIITFFFLIVCQNVISARSVCAYSDVSLIQCVISHGQTHTKPEPCTELCWFLQTGMPVIHKILQTLHLVFVMMSQANPKNCGRKCSSVQLLWTENTKQIRKCRYKSSNFANLQRQHQTLNWRN